jgi:tRNA uridine 5-carboxymethylaminomethyl modification enzyme
VKLGALLVRPHVAMDDLAKAVPTLGEFLDDFDQETLELAETNIKYESYILKEREMVDKLFRLESLSLKEDFDYHNINSLSMEARQKLTKHKPRTIGQASRISGVSPSDISILLIHSGR